MHVSTHTDLPRRSLLAALLAAGAAPAWLRHARAADVPRFELGVASGFPRPSGMVLWTRLMGADLPTRVDVQWEIARDDAFREIALRGTAVADAAWAHSVHAEPDGLAPGRPYWYRFRALGQQSATGRTRTAPAPDAAATLDFAIASCQRYDTGHYAAWRHAAQQPLDLVLFLGDYIYEYPSYPDALRRHEGVWADSLDSYRERYATYKRDPHLQAAHAACPWLCVWDDHEVANDYAGLYSQNMAPDFAAQRRAAYQAYWEHLPFPNAARPDGAAMRIYGAHDWGRLARILAVDDRQYRDRQACPPWMRGGGANTLPLQDCAALRDPKRTLLGAEQEAWLAQSWDTSRPWNLLMQQTLMARFSWRDPSGPGGGEYWTDGWDGYAPARQRLLSTLAERKIGGAVVLGGDVHAHYVAELKPDYDDAKSSIVASEFCGTSISSLGMKQSRVDAGLKFNPHVLYGRSEQRGYVRFALNEQRLEASLMVVDDALKADSAVNVAARYAVAAGRPGPQRA